LPVQIYPDAPLLPCNRKQEETLVRAGSVIVVRALVVVSEDIQDEFHQDQTHFHDHLIPNYDEANTKSNLLKVLTMVLNTDEDRVELATKPHQP
jgi:hypothetical protein